MVPAGLMTVANFTIMLDEKYIVDDFWICWKENICKCERCSSKKSGPEDNKKQHKHWCNQTRILKKAQPLYVDPSAPRRYASAVE